MLFQTGKADLSHIWLTFPIISWGLALQVITRVQLKSWTKLDQSWSSGPKNFLTSFLIAHQINYKDVLKHCLFSLPKKMSRILSSAWTFRLYKKIKHKLYPLSHYPVSISFIQITVSISRLNQELLLFYKPLWESQYSIPPKCITATNNYILTLLGCSVSESVTIVLYQGKYLYHQSLSSNLGWEY